MHGDRPYVLSDGWEDAKGKDEHSGDATALLNELTRLIAGDVKGSHGPPVYKGLVPRHEWTLVLVELPGECELCHASGGQDNRACAHAHALEYALAHQKESWCALCKHGKQDECVAKWRAKYDTLHAVQTEVLDGWVELYLMACGVEVPPPRKVVVVPASWVTDTHTDCAWCGK